MATYQEIAEWVKAEYGYCIKSCWIADRKIHHGLTIGRPDKRKGPERKISCPPAKAPMIDSALKYFGMIK